MYTLVCLFDTLQADRVYCHTGIPVGDLFVAMESWEEPERIKRSMDIILEIEAEAAKTVSAKEGLVELLQLLKESEVRIEHVINCPATFLLQLHIQYMDTAHCWPLH